MESLELELRGNPLDQLPCTIEALVAGLQHIVCGRRSRRILKAQRHLTHPFHRVKDFHLGLVGTESIDDGLKSHVRTRRPVNCQQYSHDPSPRPCSSPAIPP